MSKLYACIISQHKEALLSVAQEFSSSIESLEDGVLLDVSGLHNLIGDVYEIERSVRQRLEINNIAGNVATAHDANVAILMARQNHDGDFLQLPLSNLQIEPDTLRVFDDLGMRSIHDLLRIPKEELINRYGQKFRDVIDVIEQKSSRLLSPNVKETHLSWTYELDFTVEDFEQMIFVINHGLDKLFGQIAHFGLSTEQLEILFGLRKKKEKLYEIKTSAPTLEKSFWLKLINLHISIDPPESAIESVGVAAHFTKPRPTQRGLYSVSRPEPEHLLLTVNKIKKLVGELNVGVPVLLDRRLPEAFSLDPELLPQGREMLEIKSEILTCAFNYFRPPMPAAVTVENRRLLFITTPRFSDGVKKYSGVWKGGSQWWSEPWSKTEWDIETENNGVFRLERDEADWFLTGEYD